MATLVDTTISSMRNLVDTIDTFLTGSAGFTQDAAPTGTTTGSAFWNAASAGSNTGELYVGVDWTTESVLEMRQSTGYSGGATGLAGYNTEADFFGVNLTNAALYGFANNATNENERYAHFVLEFNRDGRFAHFGFGHIGTEKVGDWAGGAYVYGWEWGSSATQEKEPWASTHRILLDGNHSATTNTVNVATMTIRNYPNQPASGDYAIFTNGTSVPANDSSGNGVMKVEGQSRHGRWPTALLHLRGNPNNAWLPQIPIDLLAHGSTGNSTDRDLLGSMPGVRVCNIGNIQPKEIINLGGTNWQFFPWAQKILDAGTDQPASRNAGVMYQVI